MVPRERAEAVARAIVRRERLVLGVLRIGSDLLRDCAQQRADDLQLDVYSVSQSVLVAAVAYDQAETRRGRTR